MGIYSICLYHFPPHIMPGFDGTGPQGQGPLTGRGEGPCAPQAGSGYRRGWFGRGRFDRGRGWFGRGRFGRGRGWFGRGQATADNGPLTLEEEEKELETELEAVRKERESQKKK